MMRLLSASLNPKANALFSLILVILAVSMSVTEAFAQAAASSVAAGKADYLTNCADCHGQNGKGSGPNMNVIPGIKPADLTTIAARNGGVFPTTQVANTIDGRQSTPSHKRFDMPFWGVNFQEPGKEFTPESEAKAKARIDAIVAYIETLQVK